MSDWPPFLAEAVRRDAPWVLVTVATVRGSAPRAPGTRMAVFADEALGTIGGGHLEYRALGIAREMLGERRSDACRVERFPLGPTLGQCCGGTVQLLFERIDDDARARLAELETALDAGESRVRVKEVVRGGEGTLAHSNTLLVGRHGSCGALSDPSLGERATRRARELLAAGTDAAVVPEPPLLFEPIRPEGLRIALFGAGHVGRALIGMLGALPCRVTWIDPRAAEFPEAWPANVGVEVVEEPEHEVDAIAPGTYVFVMTHEHALDERICERVLGRDDLPWCGLIGSLGKRRRFERRLLARGLPSAALTRLVCPIGIEGINGKHPGEIAVAVCAQLLRERGRRVPASADAVASMAGAG